MPGLPWRGPARVGSGTARPLASGGTISPTDAQIAAGPRVIGATGGSGTRVVARIARDAGMYIGSELNAYEDALPFGRFSDRWINDYLRATGDRSELEARMIPDLEQTLSEHLAGMPGDAVAWGWKEPRSIYLVELFHRHEPSLRFLHFIRDGRDGAGLRISPSATLWSTSRPWPR